MSPINLKELILKKPYLNLYFQGSFESRGTYALNKTKGREEYYVSVEGKNLASSVAPKISALRMIGETKIRETDLVVVFGLGNPHLIQILNEKIAPNQIILFIDSSEEILSSLWDNFIYPAMEIPGRHLFLGERLLHLLWGYIESLPMSGYPVLSSSEIILASN